MFFVVLLFDAWRFKSMFSSLDVQIVDVDDDDEYLD